jgi:hypothetical protein
MPIPDLEALAQGRLREQCSVLRQVAGAADLEAAIRSIQTAPAAFCLPVTEAATAPPLAAQFVQRIEAGLRVAIATQGNLVAVRQAIRDALLGWQPEGCGDPLAVSGGRLVRLADSGVLWWQDDFLTTYMEPLP